MFAVLFKIFFAFVQCEWPLNFESSVDVDTNIISAGVAPKVNLMNPLRAGDGACKRSIHPGFETRGKSQKIEISVAPQNGLVSSKN